MSFIVRGVGGELILPPPPSHLKTDPLKTSPRLRLMQYGICFLLEEAILKLLYLF